MKQAEPATAAGHRLEVTHLPVAALRPNPWNPNRVDPETMHKLREYIRKEGLVQPLVVRKMLDYFQILGGFHRWKICHELGYAEVPCVVLDVDDKRAKLLTVNLNELSGEPVPHLMAELIHDLTRDVSLDDLSTILPYSAAELADFESLLQLPDGLDAFIEEQVEREAKDAPKVLSFVLDADAEVVERAIALLVERLEGKNRRGRALVALAAAYLEAHEAAATGAA